MRDSQQSYCPIKASEEDVRLHFERIGLRAEYEPTVGGKKPDFKLWQGDLARAYIEVESITSTPFTEAEDGVEVDPVTPLQHKIGCAAKQLKHGKDLPCMIVVDGRGTMHHLTPAEVVQGMYGTEVFLVAMDRSGQVRAGLARDNDGRMQRPGMRSPQNTTISAIGVWQLFIADLQLTDANWRGDQLLVDTLPRWALELDRMGLEGDELANLRRENGDCLQWRVQLLQIIRNPDARIPWPDDLRGAYDSVYDVTEDRMRAIRSHHGPTAMGVPPSCIFQDYDPYDPFLDGPT